MACATPTHTCHHTHTVPDTNGGLYLTRRGDFNAGAHINVFLRVHGNSSSLPGAANHVKEALMTEKRDVTFFGIYDSFLYDVISCVGTCVYDIISCVLYLSSLPHKESSPHYVATLDGGIGYVLPLSEKRYRRLFMLQSKLVQGLAHHAGLNPKAFR